MIEITLREFSENLNEYSDKVLIAGDAITINKGGKKMVLIEEAEFQILRDALEMAMKIAPEA